MTQLVPNKQGNRRDYLASYIVRGECWIYTGSINNNGYGTILGRAAHRYFYTKLVGPIPEGLQLDHLCREKQCVNPGHLEPVTQSQNIQRRPDIGRPTCPRGHLMEGDNLRTYRKPSGSVWRCCVECQKQNKKAWRARRRAAGLPAT